MRAMLDEHDLRRWRRERKLTQSRLAELLGVTQRTLINWEAGKGIPLNLAERLEPIALQLRAAAEGSKAQMVPDRLTVDTAALRPDLRLYKPRRSRQAPIERGPEHPISLFWQRQADLAALYPHAANNEPGEAGMRYVPWEFLEHPLYLAALRQFRANERPDAPLAPDASPEDLAAAGEARRLAARTEQENEEYDYCKAHGIPWRHWQASVAPETKQRLMTEWNARRNNP